MTEIWSVKPWRRRLNATDMPSMQSIPKRVKRHPVIRGNAKLRIAIDKIVTEIEVEEWQRRKKLISEVRLPST